MYSRCDFSSNYFCDDDLVNYNSHNEGVCVVFPVYMHSYVKFFKLSNNRTDFCETNSITSGY